MQIQSLRVFCDLIDTASFSEAAERNGISQSAVSQQIRNLEERYGVVFFERGKKNFAITPEGRVFGNIAREIVALHSSIDDRLRALRDVVAGSLRVATIFSIGLHELPPLVKRFRRRFPDVGLELVYLRSNQVYVEVQEGRADLGLVAYPKARKGIVTEEYSRDQLALVCAADHPLGERTQIDLADLRGCRYVAFAADLPTRKAVDRMFRHRGVHLDPLMEFDDVEAVKRAVEVESGVSILPKSVVERERITGVLRVVEIRGKDAWRPLGLVKRRTRAVSPAMREFRAMLMDGDAPAAG